MLLHFYSRGIKLVIKASRKIFNTVKKTLGHYNESADVEG